MILLSCCAGLVGCGTTNPFASQFRIPNSFGTPFQNKQEALQSIPVGTTVDQAQTVLRAHGFEQWSSLRQDHQLTLAYHLYLARFWPPEQDIWITIYLERGAVVDIEVRPGAAEPAISQVTANREVGRLEGSI
jgi:hypothetical protein